MTEYFTGRFCRHQSIIGFGRECGG